MTDESTPRGYDSLVRRRAVKADSVVKRTQHATTLAVRNPLKSARPRLGTHQSSRGALWLLFLGMIVASGLIRVYVALQPGIWVDEVFSIAMATGHSPEHPAALANHALGEYVEPVHGQPAVKWREYLEASPVALGRVIRAVQQSDTNPPLYYLLLSGWMQAAGTSDAALRLFSVLAALACFPLLWHVGHAIGGRAVAISGCLLFAFAPTAISYSVEGRMYSLTWLLGLALAYISVKLHRDGARTPLIVGWALVGSSALLTHYFLVFVWTACTAW